MARLVWLSVIELEDALERIVAAKYGPGFATEWTAATLKGEYEAQAYGGVRTLAWEEARAWFLRHVRRGRLPFFLVSKDDPPVVRTLSTDFWRSTNRADRQRQKQILERREDPPDSPVAPLRRRRFPRPSDSLTYATDEAVLTALLIAEFGDNARPFSLLEAIEWARKVKGEPPRDVPWSEFCKDVWRLCRVKDNARGYGKRTIQDIVTGRKNRK
jgi:hypothetical protein